MGTRVLPLPTPRPPDALLFVRQLLTIRKPIKVYGLIETPSTLANIQNLLYYTIWKSDSELHGRRKFLSQASKLLKLSGLIFGAEDYANAMGIQRTKELTEMLYARQQIVLWSKTYGLDCFDLVPPSKSLFSFFFSFSF
jgi:HpcH/HpaI aldolase/citrate lyase family